MRHGLRQRNVDNSLGVIKQRRSWATNYYASSHQSRPSASDFHESLSPPLSWPFPLSHPLSLSLALALSLSLAPPLSKAQLHSSTTEKEALAPSFPSLQQAHHSLRWPMRNISQCATARTRTGRWGAAHARAMNDEEIRNSSGTPALDFQHGELKASLQRPTAHGAHSPSTETSPLSTSVQVHCVNNGACLVTPAKLTQRLNGAKHMAICTVGLASRLTMHATSAPAHQLPRWNDGGNSLRRAGAPGQGEPRATTRLPSEALELVTFELATLAASALALSATAARLCNRVRASVRRGAAPTAGGACELLAPRLADACDNALGAGGCKGRHKAASGTFVRRGKHACSCSNVGRVAGATTWPPAPICSLTHRLRRA